MANAFNTARTTPGRDPNARLSWANLMHPGRFLAARAGDSIGNIADHPLQTIGRVAGTLLGGPLAGQAANFALGDNAQGQSRIGSLWSMMFGNKTPESGLPGITGPQNSPLGAMLGIPSYASGNPNAQGPNRADPFAGASSSGQAYDANNPFAGAQSSGQAGYHGGTSGGHQMGQAPGGSSGAGLGGSWGAISSAQLSHLLSGLGASRDRHAQMEPGRQSDVYTNTTTGEVREGNAPNAGAVQRAIERNRAAQKAQGLI